MIEIHDIVIVISPGQCYPGYQEMADKLKATLWIKERTLTRQNSEGMWTVVNTTKTNQINQEDRNRRHDDIALISNGKHEFLINLDGIKVIKKYTELEIKTIPTLKSLLG